MRKVKKHYRNKEKLGIFGEDTWEMVWKKNKKLNGGGNFEMGFQ